MVGRSVPEIPDSVGKPLSQPRPKKGSKQTQGEDPPKAIIVAPSIPAKGELPASFDLLPGLLAKKPTMKAVLAALLKGKAGTIDGAFGSSVPLVIATLALHPTSNRLVVGPLAYFPLPVRCPGTNSLIRNTGNGSPFYRGFEMLMGLTSFWPLLPH